MVEAAVETWPHIPVVMHQDHGASPAVCQRVDPLRLHQRDDGRLAARGHEDAGELRLQRRGDAQGGRDGACGRRVGRGRTRLPRLARDRRGRRGGRLRRRGQAVARPAADRSRRRPPISSKQTGVDALAIAIGTSHGAYKFSRKPTGDILAIDRIKEIHARIPDTHLVMHGSSSVPQEWLDDHPRAWRRRSRRPTACRSRRSARASATACAR